MNAKPDNDEHGKFWRCEICGEPNADKTVADGHCDKLLADCQPMESTGLAKPYAKKRKDAHFPAEAHRNTRGNRTY